MTIKQPPSLERVTRAILVAWFLLGAAFITLLQFNEFQWQFLVPHWLILFGLPLWIFRATVTSALQHWRAPIWLKFFLLAYGMVLFEETFSALFNHLSEGFSPPVLLLRVAQFWAFNIPAFSGLIVATWLLYTHVEFTHWEMFLLVGLTGIFSERIVTLLPVDPIAFLVFAPVMIVFYGFILSPALMSVPPTPRRKLHPALRYLSMILAWLAFASCGLWLLTALRSAFPLWFPPCHFIPCP